MRIRIVGGIVGGGAWRPASPPAALRTRMGQAAGPSPAAQALEKAGNRLDVTRMRAQKVVDRYPEIVGLLGSETADQALEEAGQALDRAEEALEEARQLPG